MRNPWLYGSLRGLLFGLGVAFIVWGVVTWPDKGLTPLVRILLGLFCCIESFTERWNVE